MDQTSYDLIMQGIEKDLKKKTKDIDQKLKDKFGKQQYVGDGKMISETQKKEAKRRQDMRMRMIAEHRKKLEAVNFKDFGGKDQVERDMKTNSKSGSTKDKSNIQRTKQEQIKKAKETNENQRPPQRKKEKSVARTPEQKAHVESLKSKWKTAKKGYGKGNFKAKSIDKSKDGKTK